MVFYYFFVYCNSMVPPVDAELEAAIVDALEADVETAIAVPSPGSTWGVIGIGTNRV